MIINRILQSIKKILTSRVFYIGIVFGALLLVPVFRLYNLQIVKGAEVAEKKEYYTVKERYIPATRGNIYDKNGVLLAYNELSYSVFLEDTAVLTTNAQKNEMIVQLYKLLRAHGYEPEIEFAIYLDENNVPQFNVSGNAELRFKKNAYGLTSVNRLTNEQKNATAAEVFDFLAHGNKSAAMFQVSDDYSISEQLDILTVRYQYFSNADRAYRYTLVTNVDEVTIAALMEAKADLPGVSVEQQTKRIYTYDKYFAHVMGYTGLINEKELEELNGTEGSFYTTTDYVGKTGIEKEFEEQLSGKKGIELITLNSSGRILSSTVKQEPVSGNNIYLTLDAELQKDYYYLLEENIMKVLVSAITPKMDYGTKGESSDDILIPIYEVYYALFHNYVLDMDKISDPNGSELSKGVYELYTSFRDYVIDSLENHFRYGNTTHADRLSEELQDFVNYFYSQMKTKKYLDTEKIDTTDPVYIAYDADKTSFYEYMVHAINSEWVSLENLGIEGSFRTTEEIYEILLDKTFETLYDNPEFDLMIYRDLIFDYKLKGKQICLLLFDQNVIEYNEADYKKVYNGNKSAYDFMIEKLENLEITPAQLALEPCSGVIVQADCRTGEVLALVNYPSYENNKLANKIDWEYYQELLRDNSNPLYNRVTQQRTATGSTIKPMMAVCGLLNNVISTSEKIHDDIIFTKIDPSPACWREKGHGNQNVSDAIMNSCNYYFFEVGYRLASKGLSKYSDSQGIRYLTETAAMFGLTENTGIEVPEAEPSVAKADAVRASIGYGHKFTATEISRYATAMATKGTVYEYTLIDRITDKDGLVIYKCNPTVIRTVTGLSSNSWYQIHYGMQRVITNSTTLKKAFSIIPFDCAAKTGTAEVSDNNAPHGLCISFAPMNDPETSVVAVISNGYSGTNAALVANAVYKRYYDIKEEVDIGEVITIGD
jgi:penicillin-binding protein 2